MKSNASFWTTAETSDLEEFEPPDPDVPVGDALPSGLGTTLVTSEWSYPEQCRALKQSKAYGGDEAEDEDEAPEES
jgi:hypothetical protein